MFDDTPKVVEVPPNLIMDTGKFKAMVEGSVRKVLDERDAKNKSTLRAVFDALWSGATQAHAALQKIFK